MLILEYSIRIDESPLDINIKQAVLALESEQPGISLDDLIKMSCTTAHVYDVYSQIERDDLWADLGSEPLAEPGHVRVFLNRNQAAAYDALAESEIRERKSGPVDMRVGSAGSLDGRSF